MAALQHVAQLEGALQLPVMGKLGYLGLAWWSLAGGCGTVPAGKTRSNIAQLHKNAFQTMGT